MQTAYAARTQADARLLGRRAADGMTLRDHVSRVVRCCPRRVAPAKVLISALACKCAYPDWDTRRHQRQLGAPHSLRSMDRRHVSSFLFRHRLVATPTEGALTRSFERPEPYERSYSGGIQPASAKASFLAVLHQVNTTSSPRQGARLAGALLRYAINLLAGDRRKRQSLMPKAERSPRTVQVAGAERVPMTSRADLYRFLQRLFASKMCPALAPVLAVYTLAQMLAEQSHGFVAPLREHTAADARTGALGDVEVWDRVHEPMGNTAAAPAPAGRALRRSPRLAALAAQHAAGVSDGSETVAAASKASLREQVVAVYEVKHRIPADATLCELVARKTAATAAAAGDAWRGAFLLSTDPSALGPAWADTRPDVCVMGVAAFVALHVPHGPVPYLRRLRCNALSHTNLELQSRKWLSQTLGAVC